MAEAFKIKWRHWFRDWLLAPRYRWFRDWLPAPRYRCIGAVDAVDEIPTALPRTAAVLVSSAGRAKWIGFDCACGTGHRILLNIDRSRYPVWSVNQSNDGYLSISPSIDYHDARRRCHYFIRDGKVIWAEDAVR